MLTTAIKLVEATMLMKVTMLTEAIALVEATTPGGTLAPCGEGPHHSQGPSSTALGMGQGEEGRGFCKKNARGKRRKRRQRDTGLAFPHSKQAVRVERMEKLIFTRIHTEAGPGVVTGNTFTIQNSLYLEQFPFSLNRCFFS